MQPTLSPAPFILKGGPVGLLLLHGFTGSPTEMSLLGPYLNRRGITVSVPLLPGHGTKPEDLNGQRAEDWLDYARHALSDLQSTCQTVFVGGLSNGSLLALEIAADSSAVAGVVAYSPAILATDRRIVLLPLLKRIVREMSKPPDQFTDPEAIHRLWSYHTYPVAGAHQVARLMGITKRDLPKVTCPALIVASTIDTIINPKAAQLAYDRLGSTDKRLVLLHNSGHVITLDSEWEQVAEQTADFIEAHSTAATAPAA